LLGESKALLGNRSPCQAHRNASLQMRLGQSDKLCLAPWALAQNLVSPIRLHFFPFPAFGLSTQAAEAPSGFAVELA
jgi:hypothetical protein